MQDIIKLIEEHNIKIVKTFETISKSYEVSIFTKKTISAVMQKSKLQIKKRDSKNILTFKNRYNELINNFVNMLILRKEPITIEVIKDGLNAILKGYKTGAEND